jgi:thiamine pyrophosphate-dependent acetolactate synthase large subunit-like protein
LVIVGDGVAFSGAQPELVRLAHILGARVYSADSSEPNYPADDPLYGGLLGHMWGSSSREKTTRGDVVLIVGTYVFPEVFPALEGVFQPGAKIISIDLDAYEMGKNFAFSLGMLADPKRSLAVLVERVESRASDGFRREAERRVQEAKTSKRRQHAIDAESEGRESNELTMEGFCSAFASRLAKQGIRALILDEAITNSDSLCRHFPPSVPGTYLQTRGGSLGIGLPGAIGAKLARPEMTVVAFAGDGAAMYTIQALWTAAHHRIGAKFVICNNRSYKLLKNNIDRYWEERGIPPRRYPASFDIVSPELRFDQMAASMGVEGVRVADKREIGPALDKMLDSRRQDHPFLIDLILAS